jgi:hypothetical protein
MDKSDSFQITAYHQITLAYYQYYVYRRVKSTTVLIYISDLPPAVWYRYRNTFPDHPTSTHRLGHSNCF